MQRFVSCEMGIPSHLYYLTFLRPKVMCFVEKNVDMHVLLTIKRLSTQFKDNVLEIERKLFIVIRNKSISDVIHVFDKYKTVRSCLIKLWAAMQRFF